MVATREGKSPGGSPYENLSDDAIVRLAIASYHRAESFPAHARAGEWERFDRLMAEMMRRAMLQVLWKLHEQGKGDSDDAKIAEVIAEVADRELAARAQDDDTAATTGEP